MEASNPGDSPTGGSARDLAKFQTELALDRTTLAWIRTTLTMASFGFGMVAFFRALQDSSPSVQTVRWHEGAVRFGLGLMILGLFATVLAAASHWFALRRLRLGQTPVLRQWPLSIVVAVLFGVLCFVGLWYHLIG
jgi:putative membrane protein